MAAALCAAVVLLAAGGWAPSSPDARDRAATDAPSLERAASDTLRVCADPNNLPYSSQAKDGFENEIAGLIAQGMNAELEFFWWPQRRGMVTRILRAGLCDVIMGVPTENEMLLTTAPYYRSGFVFVYRADRELELRSLDDPALRDMAIGVHVQEGEGNNPPALMLARRGLTQNLVGYSVYGDYSKPHPLSDIVNGVIHDSVDVAVVWGPAAGYFVGQDRDRLRVVPVETEDEPNVPLRVSISMGVRKGETQLKSRLDDALRTQWPSVQRVLQQYHVPRLALAPPGNETPSTSEPDARRGDRR